MTKSAADKLAEFLREAVQDYQEDVTYQNGGVKLTIEKIAGAFAQATFDNIDDEIKFFQAAGLTVYGNVPPPKQRKPYSPLIPQQRVVCKNTVKGA